MNLQQERIDAHCQTLWLEGPVLVIMACLARCSAAAGSCSAVSRSKEFSTTLTLVRDHAAGAIDDGVRGPRAVQRHESKARGQLSLRVHRA